MGLFYLFLCTVIQRMNPPLQVNFCDEKLSVHFVINIVGAGSVIDFDSNN
ncbi:MAG: hypothetical protein QNJ74_02890 [Trichodesmium sp. MO_231.B1]|nr:hypothetical protein [Trichodesmium sp. MO_231.B1]